MEESAIILKSVQLEFGVCELRSDSILRFVPAPTIDTVHLEQLKVMLNTLVELTDGKPTPFFTDNRKLKSMGYAEREFIGKNLHLFATASAVGENSAVIRFIAHTITHLFKPKVPMCLFSTKEDAILWLKSF